MWQAFRDKGGEVDLYAPAMKESPFQVRQKVCLMGVRALCQILRSYGE